MKRRAERLRLHDPSCAYGQCRTAAADFKRLHGGEIVEYWNPVDLSAAHESWQKTADEQPENTRYFGHSVNKVNDHIVDWTGSQFFGAGTPNPIIEHVDDYSKRFYEGPYKADEEKFVPGAYSRTRKLLKGYNM